MALPIATKRPNLVLDKGKKSGFEWVVMVNFFGFRCGYVKVPMMHPWCGASYGDLDCEVHDGLTYQDDDPDGGRWFGFDCQRAGDMPDPALRDLAEEYAFYRLGAFTGDQIRTQEYVEDQCRSLCQQAAQVAAQSLTTPDPLP